MSTNEEAQRVAAIFAKYAETGDKSLIEGLTLEEIEFAFIQHRADKEFRHYRVMKNRIAELKNLRKNIQRWKDRLIGFVFGVGVFAAVWLFSYLARGH